MRDERLHLLSNKTSPPHPHRVLYWMQASVRVDDNMALEFAAQEAQRKKLPLVVYFGLIPNYPGASSRHYAFLVEGLIEVAEILAERGVNFIVRLENPLEGVLKLSEHAALTVTDIGYTRILVKWRRELAKRADGPVLMVEDNICLPVRTAYQKAAVGARVLRPRIESSRDSFLSDFVGFPESLPAPIEPEVESIDLQELRLMMPSPSSDSPFQALPGPVVGKNGGTRAGMAIFDDFLENGLHRYEDEKNDPNKHAVSGMSPYLHFGQVSVRELARRVLSRGGPGSAVYLEELLVRRELAINYVYYFPKYDSPEVLPSWARSSLDAHAADSRPVLYAENEMERGNSADPYWNACQKEMVYTGTMHGYMRMYWGKKVIEWCQDWRRAWELLLRWNDKYELDGRDPNGYAGVAWCFGMHDRPWKERDVFGVVRYMNDKGLKRKFDVDAYVRDVDARIKALSQ